MLKMSAARRRRARRGYSLVELMFSLLIFLSCIVGILNALSDSMYHYSVQGNYAVMQMDARRALELVARDLRMAGRIRPEAYGREYPYTFADGGLLEDGSEPAALHAAAARHVPATSPGFGENREIGCKIPIDVDGDGLVTDADTGLVEWSPYDVSFVVATNASGLNQLQRWEDGVCTDIIADYVERVTFDTVRTDPTIDWNGIVVTVYMAKPTPRGVWLETQLSTTIKMRNTDEAVAPATGWEMPEE